MKPYEFKRFYHPKMGKFVCKHKGNGSIADNIFKPIRSIASTVAKPFAKKAIKSGVEHAGERLGKKAAEKFGDLIMRRLGNMRQKTPSRLKSSLPTMKKKVQISYGIV